MALELTPAGKAAIKVFKFLLVLGVVAGGYIAFQHLRPPPKEVASVTPLKVALPQSLGDLGGADHGTTTTASTATAAPSAPGTNETAAPNGTPVIRQHVWEWNSQMGKFYANGGPKTTTGSLMDKAGVRVEFIHQDDTNLNKAALRDFAVDLADGNAEPTKGVHFVSIMGDGAFQFIAGLNDDIAKLTKPGQPTLHAQIIGSSGFSRGEDKLMGPAKWKKDPQSMKGAVVIGVICDGDWNIALKYEGDNGLLNNPDTATYDPEAVNWVSADDYLKAAEMYVAGYCYDPEEVRNGKRTGKKLHLCANADNWGVVTWTPGDVNVATKKGGIVGIVSTKDYAYQMPEVLVGIDRWNEAHTQLLGRMLSAIFDGGAAVQQDQRALHRAAEISSAIYGENPPTYWQRYYSGTTDVDATGLTVSLGGSSVNTLRDNLLLFGLAPGSVDLFAATYEIFRDIDHQQYPERFPSYPNPTAKAVFDSRYIKVAEALVHDRTTADRPVYVAAHDLSEQVSSRSWTILFAKDSDRIDQTRSAAALNELARQMAITQLKIRLEGHTDSDGLADHNRELSRRRAEAVRSWLEQSAPQTFPADRFVDPVGYGADRPVALGNSASSKAQNRRVVIALGQ
jgi:OOP family OmpA-OmpF porin